MLFIKTKPARILQTSWNMPWKQLCKLCFYVQSHGCTSWVQRQDPAHLYFHLPTASTPIAGSKTILFSPVSAIHFHLLDELLEFTVHYFYPFTLIINELPEEKENSQTPVIWLRPHTNTEQQLNGSYGGGEGNFVEGFKRFCTINRHN